MPTTLTLSSLACAFGARTVFSGLDLVLADGDVTALVGPNGSGKSTLMRTLVGELPAESGTVRLAPAEATVGWLPQVTPDVDETLLEHARRRTGVAAADRALHDAAEALAAGGPGTDEAYAAALDRWLAIGAADLDDRLVTVAGQVGLHVDPHRPLGALSGGQAARASLVVVLLSRYDVLLLDEPTNDLDARGLALVTDFVREHPGPVLVASHDRAFLDEVATSVVELDVHQRAVHHYTGNWSDHRAARDLARRQAHEAYAGYAEQRDHLLAQARQRMDWAAKGHRDVKQNHPGDKFLAERFKARADKQGARSARIKAAVDRLEAVEQPRKEWQLRYAIDAGPPSADVVLTLQKAVVTRGSFSPGSFSMGPVDLVVERGDRLAITGDNGAGKSTLLGALLGTIPLTEGTRSLGARVRLGAVDQQRTLLETDAPVADVVRRELGVADRGKVRTLLAKFGLGADHVDRPARTLSMGERTRALMALFQARQVNLLVLDEPTNHLDVDAIEQLEQALAAYDGTLVVVSHDRAFRDAVGVTRVIEL